MSEIINETNTAETVGKTFTQDDVNRIVGERLTRERDKRTAELDEREKAVKARELAVIAAEKLAAAGLPKGLSAVLKYDDENSLDAAISQLSTLRGFKAGNTSNKEGKKTVLVNKLPELSEQNQSEDVLLRKAFQIKNE